MLGSSRFPLTSPGVVATLALLSATGASAQADTTRKFDRTPRECLAVSRIRNTDILDTTRTILFFLRGNKLMPPHVSAARNVSGARAQRPLRLRGA